MAESASQEEISTRGEPGSGSEDGHILTRQGAGTSTPVSRLRLSRGAQLADDPRPVVAIDWSGRGVHATFDGKEVTKLGSTEELLEQLTEPHVIVAEATFESWDRERRQDLVQRIRAAGHEILVYRPIHTARQRPEKWSKTDEHDALVIYRIAQAGQLHLYPLPEPVKGWPELFEEVNRAYGQLRLSGAKEEMVRAAEEALGPYSEQSEEIRQALGNGRGYMSSVVAAAYHAARYAGNREAFERLLGLHGSGYPSILRSEVHHHGFRHLRKRDVSWAQFRRALRWAYQQFKAEQQRDTHTG